jgi:predicted nuclease of restriction endonuclease-like (RecB) superfamily
LDSTPSVFWAIFIIFLKASPFFLNKNQTYIIMELILKDIRQLITQAQQQVLRQVNSTMVQTYWLIGKRIVEEEQHGRKRAKYASELLGHLSETLTKEFGEGFSATNLRQMRHFFLAYPIQQTPSAELDMSNAIGQQQTDQLRKFPHPRISWSHYVFLMRLKDLAERAFYEIETAENMWNLKELKRQFNSALYQRLALSRDKEGIKALSREGWVIENPIDAIKDPYILEFLGLEARNSYSEAELETAIIDQLEAFLLELGKGFTFVARQKRLTFDEKHFHIDLVFYNRFLKAFVLIDLKIGELEHKDLGQMQMYVNYYDREMRLPDENRTVGIVLCRYKSEMVVEYTLPEDNTQIFASQYALVLPSKEDFMKILKRK